VVELTTGLSFFALYMKLGLVWYLPFVAGSFAALFALVMIDFKYMAVPDNVNFAALIFALIQPNFLEATMYAVIAAGGLYVIGLLSSLLAGRQAMGGADVIVAGTMGALLGFPNFFAALFLSALLAIIPSLINRETGVPFVPFLALATFIVYLYDTQTYAMLESLIYG
jgi:leader peptidase (prepilin peptidase)/N-methyltransferase